MGFEAVSWNKVGTIAASWVVSPAISGTMAFLLFLSAKKFILDRRDPSQAAVSLIPIYSFFVAVIIGLVTARKGLKHVGLPLTDNEVLLVTVSFGIIVAVISGNVAQDLANVITANVDIYFSSSEKCREISRKNHRS